MNLHRELNEVEVKEFQQWAKDNWKEGDEVKEIWHPVILAEIKRIQRKNLIIKHLDKIKRVLKNDSILLKSTIGTTFVRGYLLGICETNEKDVCFEIALLRGGNGNHLLSELEESVKLLS